MRLGGYCASAFLAAIVLVPFGVVGNAHAGVIANWDKSDRSWNSLRMTKIKAAMQGAGHRVEGDGVISGPVLKSCGVYLIGEPTATPTVAELVLLRQFALDGGIIFIFGDTGIDRSIYNNLLAGIGSTITFATGTISTTSALPVGKFTESPWNIAGDTLAVTSGNDTAGGTLIDNNYVRYEKIGAGYIVTFGDRIDHDDFISDINTKLLLNIVSVAIGPPVQIPAISPVALGLASLLLMGLGAARLASRSR